MFCETCQEFNIFQNLFFFMLCANHVEAGQLSESRDLVKDKPATLGQVQTGETRELGRNFEVSRPGVEGGEVRQCFYFCHVARAREG
jgi:hypothetical protein